MVKFFNYILISTDKGNGKFITKYNEHGIFCDENEKPLEFTRKQAMDISFQLTLGGYPAVIVESYHIIETHRFYKKEDK